MKLKSKKEQKGGGSYTLNQLYQFNLLSINKLKSIGDRFEQKTSKAKSEAKSETKSDKSIHLIKNTKRVKSLESEHEQSNNYYKNALKDLSELDEKEYTGRTLLLLDDEGHISKDIISSKIIHPKNAIFISNNGRSAFIYPVKQVEEIEQKDINNYAVYDMFYLYKWILKNHTLPHNRNEISDSVIEIIETIVIPVTQAFLTAIKNGDSNKIKLLIQRGVDVNFKHGIGRTPLHWAAFYGHNTSIKALLDTLEVEVNAKDDNGSSPLHLAAQNGNTNVVRELLSTSGIMVNAQDNDRSTPLHEAARKGHAACVNLLLSAPGILVNAKDSEGLTPLHQAALMGEIECLNSLLAARGINVNAKDNSGLTPIKLAYMAGKIDCVRRLISAPGIQANT